MTIITMNLFIWFLFLILTTIIHHSISARILDPQSPSHHHHPLTFFMQEYSLTKSTPLLTPQTNTHQIPFPNKPPIINGAIPAALLITGSSSSSTAQTHQILDLSGIGWSSFPAMAASTALQGLTLGTVTAIDEILIAGRPLLGFSLIGKAQGVRVASSEDGNSHMMALNVLFASGDYKDGLKFFGVVHQPFVTESHIAVIGGRGRYFGANGYATIKAVSLGIDHNDHGIGESVEKFLLFNIYLS